MNRYISSLIIALFSLATLNAQNKNTTNMENLNLTSEWDKTFPKSNHVNHKKVTFTNRSP